MCGVDSGYVIETVFGGLMNGQAYSMRTLGADFDITQATRMVIGEDEEITPVDYGHNFGNTDYFEDGKCTYYFTDLKNASHMFEGCATHNIDLSHCDFSKVEDFSYMFHSCGLKGPTFDFSDIDTQNATNMSYMFSEVHGDVYDTGLTSIDVSFLKSGKVTDMSHMFAGEITYSTDTEDYNRLTSVTFGGIDTSSVTNMLGMFSSCSKLTTIDIDTIDTSNVENMCDMFYNATSLSSSTISKIQKMNTSKVKNMSWMFCTTKITSLDLSAWDLSKVENMSYMFYDCPNLTYIKISSAMPNLTNAESMFEYTETTGTIYLKSGNDYSLIIEQLPSTWSVVRF